MFSQSNQNLKTIDILQTLGSFALLALLILPILKRQMGQAHTEQALEQSRRISEDFLRGNQASRTPASADSSSQNGSRNLDPWGRPYIQSVVQNDQGQPLYIIVWSYGPDGRPDSESQITQALISHSRNVRFVGDDIGLVRSVR